MLQIEGPKQVARRSDMDMNGHINNVTYLAWALETVPAHVYDTHKLYEVRAHVAGPHHPRCTRLCAKVLVVQELGWLLL